MGWCQSLASTSSLPNHLALVWTIDDGDEAPATSPVDDLYASPCSRVNRRDSRAAEFNVEEQIHNVRARFMGRMWHGGLTRGPLAKSFHTSKGWYCLQ
jgi:hypothetical protein